MHEYDINALREEQTRLPTSTSSTSTRSSNNCRNNQQQHIYIQTPRQETTTLHLLQQSQPEASTNLIATDDQQQLSSSSANSSATYPATQHTYTDLIVEPPKTKVVVQVPKRKRPRRVYVAEFSRCASLRSRQSAHIEVIPLPEIPLSPSPTPTEFTEDYKNYYIKPEHFNPEFWNRIEEEPEVKPTGRKRRGAVGFRNRKRRNRPDLDSSSIFSPETAAAIAAAQIELDSAKPVSRAIRKRKLSSGNMSLYDRRYQTSNDEQRRVANGYASGGSGLRAGNSAGAGDIDTAELQITHHYYVPGVGGSSSSSIATTGTGSGINGSGGGSSAALNHVPAMGTLCNIGNTCYLNSVVYTLRCAPHFLHNLHHLIHDLNVVQQTMMRQHNAKSASLGRNVSGVAQLEHARSWSSKDLATTEPSYNNSTVSVTNGSNNTSNNGNNTSGSSTNKKPSHQMVSEMLHELYNSLHGNEMADSSEPHHADTLLHAVQDVNATFEGNQQQDAHEFLMCLLNCIRETNQSLLKAIADCPEVIANGYIANPDDADTVDAQERSDAGGNHAMLGTAGNGSIATSQSQNTTTTKTSFFSRKSKRNLPSTLAQ